MLNAGKHAQITQSAELTGSVVLADEPIGVFAGHACLRVPVGVAYGSDIDQVIACLMKISADHPNVCRDPEPRVRLRTFGDSSIGFELLVWIAEPVLRGLVLHELNCEVYRSFA